MCEERNNFRDDFEESRLEPLTLISLLTDFEGASHYTFLDFANETEDEPFVVTVKGNELDVRVQSVDPINVSSLQSALAFVKENVIARRMFQSKPSNHFPFNPDTPKAARASGARPEFKQAMEEVFGPGGRVIADLIDRAVEQIVEA